MKDINKIIGEMITHIPLCTHKDPKDIIIIDNFNIVKSQISQYNIKNIYYKTFEELLSTEFNTIDIIIINQRSPLDNQSISNIYNILKEDGLIIFQTDNFDDQNSKLINDLQLVNKFWIAMPTIFENQIFILASKKYHPQADIILQRSDFLNDLYYYNSDIQKASFTMPTYIKKRLLGISKN